MHLFIFPDMGQTETANHVSGLIIQHYIQLRGLFNLLFFIHPTISELAHAGKWADSGSSRAHLPLKGHTGFPCFLLFCSFLSTLGRRPS